MKIKHLFKILILTILATSLTFVASLFPSLTSLENQTIDARILRRSPETKTSEDIVMVWLDETTMQKLPYRSPVPRDFLANLLSKIISANPKLIALDIFFESPSFKDADEKLLKVLNESTVPIFEVVPRRPSEICENLPKDADGCVQLPYEPFYKAVTEIGLADLPFNPYDSTVRRAKPYFITDLGETSTLASLLFNKITNQNVMSILNNQSSGFDILDNKSQFLIRFAGVPSTIGSKESTFPTYQALLVEKGILPKRFFENKVVLVGAAYGDSEDSYLTPYYTERFGYKRMNGVEIHANILSQLLTNQFYYIPKPFILWSIVFILAFGIIITTSKLTTIKSTLITILLFIIWTYLCFEAFYYKSIVLPIVIPLAGIIITYALSIAWKALVEGRQKRWIKGVFSKYVPPAVVEQMTANPDLLKLGGENRIVTSLFSDIASFTSISEKMDPPTLVQFLNEYLSLMNEVIFKYNGTIDKYEGDAVIAFFNAPLDVPHHELNGVMAAMEIQNISKKISETWAKKCGREIITRVGLNTGHAVVGNMGSEGRFDYTAIGDTINLASRLEGTNKFYNTHVMISEFSANSLSKEFNIRPIDKVRVKGKSEAVTLYEPFGESIETNLSTFINEYIKAWDLFYEKKFDDALTVIVNLKKQKPDDGPTLDLEKRCMKAKKDSSWDLITNLESK